MDSTNVTFTIGPLNSQGYLVTDRSLLPTAFTDTDQAQRSSTPSSASSSHSHIDADSKRPYATVQSRPEFASVSIITEAFRRHADQVANKYDCQIQVETISRGGAPIYGVETHNLMLNFSLSGPAQHVNIVGSALRRDSPIKVASAVTVDKNDLVEPTSVNSLRSCFTSKAEEISRLTNTHIIVLPTDERNSVVAPPGLEAKQTLDILISGSIDGVEHARLQILVALDEQRGLSVETFELDQVYHSILCGRKRTILHRIMEETMTNIYIPTPFSGVFATPGQQSYAEASSTRRNTVWITGEFMRIQRAWKQLNEQLSARKSHVTTYTFTLPHRKIDWLLNYHLDDLKSIMDQNGVLFVFPAIGSNKSTVLIHGDCRASVERAIRSASQLASKNISAAFWLLPATSDLHYLPYSARVPPYSVVRPLLTEISCTTRAEIVFSHSNRFEIFGSDVEVDRAFNLLTELPFVKAFHVEAKFVIQLSNEHRDFVSGKKNGKINKIMKTANIKVKFDPFNEFDFAIELHGTDPRRTLEGLRLTLEELPAEVSFLVPENFHKRIIGVGGKNIQRIMSQFHVYVKFSSAEEMAALGGYHGNEHNVVVRTPAKNRDNLEPTKRAILMMVDSEFTPRIKIPQHIPHRFHRLLLADQAMIIRSIEQATNAEIRFPDREAASDVIYIKGTADAVAIAASRTLCHVPHVYFLRVPLSEEIVAFSSNAKAQAQLAQQLRHDYHVDIEFPRMPLNALSTSKNDASYALSLRVTRDRLDCLPEARDSLIDLLKTQGIPLYKNMDARARSDSFTNSLPHFNSVLFGGAGKAFAPETPRDSELSPTTTRFAPFSSTADIFGFSRDGNRTVKTSSSAQDLRSRYNSTPDEVASEAIWAATKSGLPTQLPATWSRADSLYSSRVDNFAHGGPSYVPTPTDYSLDNRYTTEGGVTYKRGSDSMVQEKWREMTKPRTIPRATSMDLGTTSTSSYGMRRPEASRQLVGNNSIPFPASAFTPPRTGGFPSQADDAETLTRYIGNLNFGVSNGHGNT